MASPESHHFLAGVPSVASASRRDRFASSMAFRDSLVTEEFA
jgi:hypothetical protein